MICFLFAMEKEASPLLKESHIEKTIVSGYAKIHFCRKEGKSFLCGVTGIGKVFAGSAVTAIKLYYPEVTGILNIGVGGSLDGDIAPLLSLVIGEKYVQHDMDTSPIGDPVGLISGINKVYFEADKALMGLLEEASKDIGVSFALGNITSGDKFIASKEEREAIKAKFRSLSCDMESAAMAQVAYCYNIPFCAARVISDTGKDPNEYADNCLEAARRGKMLIDKVLELI